MSEFTNTIDLLGDTIVLNSIIDRSIVEFKDNILTKIGSGAFQYCINLKTVDLPSVISIESNGVRDTNLSTLFLRSNILCTLYNQYALSNSPIASGNGYIYAPRALIEDYKVATNWAVYANQFRALEDYTIDGTTTGDLDETKI